MRTVTIHADGACSGNPGRGGWAAVLECDGHRREVSGGVRLTTNMRMELTAILSGLACLKRTDVDVTVSTDCKVAADLFTSGNLESRLRSGKAANADLWERILAVTGRLHSVAFEWVRGHAGNAGNERCNSLAQAETRRGQETADEGYERLHCPTESGGSLFDGLE